MNSTYNPDYMNELKFLYELERMLWPAPTPPPVYEQIRTLECVFFGFLI